MKISRKCFPWCCRNLLSITASNYNENFLQISFLELRRALNSWFANFFYQSVILQRTFELVQSVDND